LKGSPRSNHEQPTENRQTTTVKQKSFTVSSLSEQQNDFHTKVVHRQTVALRVYKSSRQGLRRKATRIYVRQHPAHHRLTEAPVLLPNEGEGSGLVQSLERVKCRSSDPWCCLETGGARAGEGEPKRGKGRVGVRGRERSGEVGTAFKGWEGLVEGGKGIGGSGGKVEGCEGRDLRWGWGGRVAEGGGNARGNAEQPRKKGDARRKGWKICGEIRKKDAGRMAMQKAGSGNPGTSEKKRERVVYVGSIGTP
jgi:hypothetical protein